MSKTKEYVGKLFNANNIVLNSNKEQFFENFITQDEIILSVDLISQHQIKIMENWRIKESIYDIINNQIQITNGTVGKDYKFKVDFNKLNWTTIVFFEFEGLEKVGLSYNNDEEIITGKPVINGDFKITLKFRVDGENENSILNEKSINLIINSDPKSLWKTLPSDTLDKYWKEDEVTDFKKIGDKKIVVASKRGRSHANVGSYRDDDFAFQHFEATGWSVVAVSDGAGSAKNSRKGSQIACNEVINYVENNFDILLTKNFDNLLFKYAEEKNQKSTTEQNILNVEKKTIGSSNLITETIDEESNQIAISKFIYTHLGSCAKHVHNKLEEFANKNEFPLKDLHSTLIFSLFKKYDFGYVILSFGVGDCPIVVLNKDKTDLKLMNWLDVGEFGGGTRFITMPEIFQSENFSTRFGFKLIEDFSYLMLMTDGIYDAKFSVEANLEKLDKWHEFIADLEGQNEDNVKVIFDATNNEIGNQLSNWMDFWSPGNHDDRTLAIVF